MAEFLLGAAGFVLAMVALGLVRILRGPGDADRMMAAQLLGTGGIAALLLLGAATGDGAVVDVALTLALLAAFASIAFVKARARRATPTTPSGGPRMSAVARPARPIVAVVGAARSSSSPAPSGLLRFPDTLTRLHALTKADNLGLGLVVLGLLPQVDGVLRGLKLVVHLAARAAGRARPSSQLIARARAARASPAAHDRASLERRPGRLLIARAGASGRSSRATRSPRSSASSPTACC